MPATVAIEIVSDVICPWCFIGKRRLEKALALLGDEVEVEVAWLPFQLNPGMPAEGIARADYRRAKFGEERSRELDARVAAEAAGEGLAFALERQARTPNTFAAHQLIELAQEQGAGEAVVEALFGAYFEQARDIGDRGVLSGIAAECGVRADALEARWGAEADRRRLAQLEEQMKALGISGVPTFIFGRRLAVSGAQAPEALAAAIREAAVPA
ncbi:MAG: DsbA family oxidoreductase [Burkholderiales bacterium]